MVPAHQPPTALDAIAIHYLDEIGAGDPESAHGDADDIILALVHPEVRAAYSRLVDRCAWWVTA